MSGHVVGIGSLKLILLQHKMRKKSSFFILTEFWNSSGLDVEAVDEAGHDCSGKVFIY
jgi:hypothetical protein